MKIDEEGDAKDIGIVVLVVVQEEGTSAVEMPPLEMGVHSRIDSLG